MQTLDDQSAVTYNASTMWFIGDTLLYYQDGLDPTKTHTVTVLPTVGAGLKFWLNTITVFTDDPSEAGGLARYVSRMNFHVVRRGSYKCRSAPPPRSLNH